MKIDLYKTALQKHNINPNEAQVEILKTLSKLDNEIILYTEKDIPLISTFLKKKERPKGIYLHGSVGTGKSTLMDLFFDELDIEKKHKVHFHAFMLEIHHYLHNLQNSPNNKKDIDLLKYASKYIAKQYQVLYVDELQISDIADAMIVGKLFRELMAQDVIIVITSNFAPEELYLNGLQRDSFLPFIDLIQDTMTLIKIDSVYDYRRSKLQSVETTYYLYNDVMDSQKFIFDSFLKLTNNSNAENMMLKIDGHELFCPITALDCTIFTFDQLCRSPLASSDYIAICQEFNVIILADIPELTSEEHNEAKRFIHLIDTIYDFKKTLICSSTTDIDSIYKAGKWNFEFKRTASRLHHMQTEDYLNS
jgi:cell division protein ZapE